ncbi:MAG: type II secretion system F family protein [Bdellovibrionota bacterium]
MILAVFGAIMIGGAFFYIVYSTMSAADQLAAEERLGLSLEDDKAAKKLPFYIKVTSPLLREPYINLGTQFWNQDRLTGVKKRLVSAGMGQVITPEQFVASKFFLFLFISSFFILIQLFGTPPPPLFSIGFSLFSFFIPDLHLSNVRAIRQREIKIAMPYIIDLLALCMEAGLDFMGAVGKVIEKAPLSPFVEELSVVLKDIQLGKTRAKALKDMSARIDMLEISSLVAIIVSADQMGASVGNALRGSSDLLRNERIMKAEELAAKASQKILVPLIFLILPAVMLIIIGPVVLAALGVK